MRALLVAGLLMAPFFSAQAQQSDLLWPFTSGGSFGQQMRASKLNAGGVLQGAATQSSKLTAAAVLQNTSVRAAKIVGYVVLQSEHAAIVIRAPLTHW